MLTGWMQIPKVLLCVNGVDADTQGIIVGKWGGAYVGFAEHADTQG